MKKLATFVTLKSFLTYIKIYRHRLLYLPIFLLFSLSFIDCAKRGTPSGGAKDSVAPVIVKSSPENYSTNFTGNEIRIYFDEYIKLEDLQKNLIVSPPLDYTPLITPLNTSKQLRIKILDTLKENTTYSFNFGKSIVDNNEGNQFPYFKYVFSTGSYIDSLTLRGKISDALLPRVENPVNVLLYAWNEDYTDSLIFKKKPTYITVTQDSSDTFQLTNLKEGSYLLLALKEKNSDYIFQPKNDKIGYVLDTIVLPTDSTYTLRLFREQNDYKIGRATHLSKTEIIFGYEGNGDSLTLKPLSEVPSSFEAMVYKDATKDTLHYWFKPPFNEEATDSLLLLAQNKARVDTVDVRLKNLFIDSLKISVFKGGTLIPKDTFQLQLNTPLVEIDENLISVMDKDSIIIPVITTIDKKFNRAKVYFNKSFDQNYFISMLPGALTDFYEATNDTIRYRVQTKAEDDYGGITINIVNVPEVPVYVELVDDRFEIVRREALTADGPVVFDVLEPGFYYVRLIYDTNRNGTWDSGNFLRKEQPERILYYPDRIEVRANWFPIQTFTLD